MAIIFYHNIYLKGIENALFLKTIVDWRFSENVRSRVSRCERYINEH